MVEYVRKKIIERVKQLIEEDEKRGWEWSEAAKKMVLSKAAFNWAKSRCLGAFEDEIPIEEWDESIIECIARNMFVYAKKFGERWGLIKPKSTL